MDKVARVGIDLAKRVFHVTAVDADGAVLERRKLRRAGLQSYLALLPAGCTVAMEACGGAHHWGRLAAGHGHRVLLMSPQFVAPYVKSNKNDVNDADAIAEASGRPTMRFVGLKTARQEHVQQLHRVRQMAVRNRTAQCNQIHGLLLEYGVESPKGVAALRRRLPAVPGTRRTNCRRRRVRCSGNWATSCGGWTSGSRGTTRIWRRWRGTTRPAGG